MVPPNWDVDEGTQAMGTAVYCQAIHLIATAADEGELGIVGKTQGRFLP